MNFTYFDRARAALEESIDLDELKEICDKAEALRSYAGQATEMGRQCAAIRLRAERRLGASHARRSGLSGFLESCRIVLGIEQEEESLSIVKPSS